MTDRAGRLSRPTAFVMVLLAGSSVIHFVRPAPFVSIVPRMLPHKLELVYLSGAAELISAGLLAAPATRKVGGEVAAGLFAAVFPANVSMALRSGGRPGWYQAVAWFRLPLQLPLIWWAWKSGRQSAGTAG